MLESCRCLLPCPYFYVSQGLVGTHLASEGLIDLLVADRNFDTVTSTARHLVHPVAALGLRWTTRWGTSNSKRFLSIPRPSSTGRKCYKVLLGDPLDTVIAWPASLTVGVAKRMLGSKAFAPKQPHEASHRVLGSALGKGFQVLCSVPKALVHSSLQRFHCHCMQCSIGGVACRRAAPRQYRTGLALPSAALDIRLEEYYEERKDGRSDVVPTAAKPVPDTAVIGLVYQLYHTWAACLTWLSGNDGSGSADSAAPAPVQVTPSSQPSTNPFAFQPPSLQWLDYKARDQQLQRGSTIALSHGDGLQSLPAVLKDTPVVNVVSPRSSRRRAILQGNSPTGEDLEESRQYLYVPKAQPAYASTPSDKVSRATTVEQFQHTYAFLLRHARKHVRAACTTVSQSVLPSTGREVAVYCMGAFASFANGAGVHIAQCWEPQEWLDFWSVLLVHNSLYGRLHSDASSFVSLEEWQCPLECLTAQPLLGTCALRELCETCMVSCVSLLQLMGPHTMLILSSAVLDCPVRGSRGRQPTREPRRGPPSEAPPSITVSHLTSTGAKPQTAVY